jgi:hypothetical protein
MTHGCNHSSSAGNAPEVALGELAASAQKPRRNRGSGRTERAPSWGRLILGLPTFVVLSTRQGTVMKNAACPCGESSATSAHSSLK